MVAYRQSERCEPATLSPNRLPIFMTNYLQSLSGRKMNWKRFRYISFDCYGTLVDWEKGLRDALSELFDEYRVIPSEKVLRVFSRLEADAESGNFRVYREVLRQVHENLCQYFQINDTSHPFRLADSIKKWHPFPDTIPALQKLQKRWPLVVLSNVDDDLFEATQQQLRIKFDKVFTAQQIKSYKPDIENFKFMLKKLNCHASEVLHVGGSLYHDHVPAKNLGMTTVWIKRNEIPNNAGQSLSWQVEPDFVVENMTDFAALVTEASSP